MADKKKRGEAGKANAEAKPFRLNGGGCYPLHLRQTLATVPGLIQQIGKAPVTKKS